jgi:hypothetical protein
MVAVPLAFWSALPTVRWCLPSVDSIRVACVVPCVVGTECPSGACDGNACAAEPAPDVACAESACGENACDAGEPEVPGTSLPAEPCAEATTFPCGLAFCLDGPTGGDGVPAQAPAQPDPPSITAAVLSAALDAPEAPARRGWLLEFSEENPAHASRASSHQARAPPASV